MSCKKKACGCTDTGLVTATPCEHDTPDCPNPDPCSETFSSSCVIYNKDTIVSTGINKGDNMSNILQIVSLWLTNPLCITPGATCKSVIGVQSSVITSTAVKLIWSLNGVTPTNSQVEYKLASAGSWSLNTLLAGSTLTDTIVGLTPNSEYHFRVNAICPGPSSCYSVTISVTTNV